MPILNYREIHSRVLKTYTLNDNTIVESQTIYYDIEKQEFLLIRSTKNLDTDEFVKEDHIRISESEFLSCKRVWDEDTADIYSKNYDNTET